MVFYVCMQVNMMESVVCWFWVSMWETFCRDTNVRFCSRIGAVPESKEDQEVSSIPPPAMTPLIAVREWTHADTNPRQGHSSMAAKIISRMQFGCLGVPLPPGTFIMYQVLLQALNNRTRKTLFHLRVFKWEREPPKTSGSKEQSWGLSSGNGSVHTNAWHWWAPAVLGYNAYSKHHPSVFSQKDALQHSKKEFSQSVILRYPYQGVFTRFLNPVFKHQGKISPWKPEILAILSRGKLF